MNPFASTRRRPRRGDDLDDAPEDDRRPRAHVGLRPRLRVRPRRRDARRSSTTRARAHRRSRRCSRWSRSCARRVPGARIALPVVGEPRGRAHRRARAARRSCGRSSRPRTSWRSRAASDVDFAASQEGGFIWPDFLPAYDAAATLVQLLDLLAAVDRPLSSVVRRAPRAARRARDGADAVGAQGHGDARR